MNHDRAPASERGLSSYPALVRTGGGNGARARRGARPNTAEVAMPKAMRVCPTPGCPELTPGGPCDECRPARERARGTRQQRGYDAQHDRLRRQWKPKVERVSVHCHAKVCVMPARLILPGQPWDLGHTDDRTTWTGPEHATCNRAAGGRAAHGG